MIGPHKGKSDLYREVPIGARQGLVQTLPVNAITTSGGACTRIKRTLLKKPTIHRRFWRVGTDIPVPWARKPVRSELLPFRSTVEPISQGALHLKILSVVVESLDDHASLVFAFQAAYYEFNR